MWFQKREEPKTDVAPAIKVMGVIDERKRLQEACELSIKDKIEETKLYYENMRDANVSLHDGDVRSYAFSCKRFGDFLTINIESSFMPNKFAETFNLSKVLSISMVSGKPPNFFKTGHWHFQIENGNCYSSPVWLPRDGTDEKIRGYFILGTMERVSFRHDERNIKREYSDNTFVNFGVKVTTEVHAPSEPDSICLRGVGTIYAPFGVGKSVHDAILSEIKNGAPQIVTVPVRI